MTSIYLAMMWRNRDGSLTLAFAWAVVLSTLMIAFGIWGFAAPESLRLRYFKLLNQRPRGGRVIAPRDAWAWSSPTRIRLGSVLAIAVAGGFLTWVVFFTAPGVAY
jgi:hypothetical protein